MKVQLTGKQIPGERVLELSINDYSYQGSSSPKEFSPNTPLLCHDQPCLINASMYKGSQGLKPSMERDILYVGVAIIH